MKRNEFTGALGAMALELKQGLKFSQQLQMTPQLQQAIRLLQLSRLELGEFISEQLAENPVLEENDDTSGVSENTEEQVITEHLASAAEIVDSIAPEGGSEVDWENLARMKEAAQQSPVKRQREDGSVPHYENVATRAQSLSEHLGRQIAELGFSERELCIAAVLIGNLDERGYIASGLDELCSRENIDPDELAEVLDTIQRLDPSGVGARDLQECLLIQLRNGKRKNGIVERIVEKHLSLLASRNFQVIAKDLAITVERVIENVQTISDLEPNPGRQFEAEAVQYITPDVYVFQSGDKWIVSLNEDGLPRVKISEHYRELFSEQKRDSKDRSYFSGKLKEAEWLIKSIQQRQSTIYRVTCEIVAKQRDFFEHGIEHLKPMILKDIAKELDLHESTISRVTSAKYAHTPRGIFELKFFFNSAVSGTRGAGVASETVKRKIAALVRGEDPKRPRSDQALVTALEKDGIQLARRTVAKYREQLDIPPSSKRKKYF